MYSGFPPFIKTNISKFQFDLDYCQAHYHEPPAREIAQALLRVIDIKKNYILLMLMSQVLSLALVAFVLLLLLKS